ncbi:MAG TPA: hypothetical protein VJA25_05550 [Dehalococcoidia bacterium]|nr:hypothetical protein [Dehalococcoidia bacterium]
MTDIDKAIATLRKWEERASGHYTDDDPPHGSCEGCRAKSKLAALGRNCILPLVEALRALHDATDTINTETSLPGRYCRACRTHTFNAEEGVVHEQSCGLALARRTLAQVARQVEEVKG